MPILRRSDGLYCCLCFYSGNVADCAASSGEESGKIRTNFPMVISPIGDLLYHAASLVVIVILLARHDVCGEIFCFSTSSSFVVFVGVAWSWRASTSSPMTCMVGVQEESCWILLLLPFVNIGDVVLIGVDLWSLDYQPRSEIGLVFSSHLFWWFSPRFLGFGLKGPNFTEIRPIQPNPG